MKQELKDFVLWLIPKHIHNGKCEIAVESEDSINLQIKDWGGSVNKLGNLANIEWELSKHDMYLYSFNFTTFYIIFVIKQMEETK